MQPALQPTLPTADSVRLAVRTAPTPPSAAARRAAPAAAGQAASAGGRPAARPAAHRAAPAGSGPAAGPAAHRDSVLDLVRIGCLIVVVILHAMMSGAELSALGGVQPQVALSTTAGFAAASWGFQIMPLFFFIGGCAALSQYRRFTARGADWPDYLRTRLRRLLVPVLILILVAGAGLSLAGSLGLDPALAAEASLRIGQPLWFLAVYVGLTSLVPLAAGFHARAPKRTLAVLAAGVVAVDVLARVTGVHALGYLNFLFVWPLIQQCGFFLADSLATGRQSADSLATGRQSADSLSTGRQPAGPRSGGRHRLRTGVGLGVAAASLGLLGLLVAAGVYSPNMIVNLNPPTGALVLLGIAQMSILVLAHAPLSRWLAARRQTGRWQQAIAWGNTHGMYAYLWHMPLIIAIIAVLGQTAGSPTIAAAGLDGLVLPGIETPAWWLTRLPWVAAVLTSACLLAVPAARLGAPADAVLTGLLPARIHALPVRIRAVAAVLLGIGGIAVALLAGVAPLGLTMTACALLLTALALGAGLTR